MKKIVNLMKPKSQSSSVYRLLYIKQRLIYTMSVFLFENATSFNLRVLLIIRVSYNRVTRYAEIMT